MASSCQIEIAEIKFSDQTELVNYFSLLSFSTNLRIYRHVTICLICYEAEEITWFSTVEEPRLVTLESKYSNQDLQKYSAKHRHFSQTYFNQN